MTITNSPKWSMRLTHEPTGLFVEVDSNHFRTQQKAKEAGLKLLKSKIKVLTTQTHKNLNEDLLISYALPDDVYLPEDLQEYKENKEGEEHMTTKNGDMPAMPITNKTIDVNETWDDATAGGRFLPVNLFPTQNVLTPQ